MSSSADPPDPRLHRLLASAPGVACTLRFVAGQRPTFVYASERIRELYGCAPEPLSLDTDLIDALLAPGDGDSGIRAMEQSASELAVWRRRFSVRHRTRGETIWIEAHLVPQREPDDTTLWDGFLTDITEAKEQEIQATSLNRLLRTLSEANQAIVRAASEQEFLQRICRIAADTGGFVLATIGLVRPDLSLRAVASAGTAKGYVEGLRMSADASIPEGRGPAGEVLRTGRHVVTQDFLSDPRTAPWHERARAHGIAASIGLPLLLEGRVLGVFSVYGSSRGQFRDRDIALLTDIAADIAFGLDTIERVDRLARTSAALRQTMQRLHSIESTMRAGSFRVSLPGWDTWWSEGARALLGLPPGASDAPPSMLATVLPDAHMMLVSAFRSAVESADNVDIDLPLGDDAGSRRWVRVYGVVARRDATTCDINGTVQDVTEQKRLETEVMSATEAERQRLGAELHDDLGQVLVGASLAVAALRRQPAAADAALAPALDNIAEILRHALGVARRLAHGMLSHATGQLLPSLRTLCDTTSASGVTCRLDAGQQAGAAVSKAECIEVYRIAQEAVTNALKHAHCSSIFISIADDAGVLELTVADDGVGVRAGETVEAPGGVGFRTMRYRAARIGGAFTLQPRSDGGTVVRLLIPHRSQRRLAG